MPEKTPADRKDGSYTFTVKGKTYKLPPLGTNAENIPGAVTYAAVMDPDSEFTQMRLAFASLEAAGPSPAAKEALLSLPTKDMLTIVGEWMGESSGSSD